MLARSSKLEKLLDDESGLCAFCEMTVFWMQVELRKERTKEKAFEYVNQVNPFLCCSDSPKNE